LLNETSPWRALWQMAAAYRSRVAIIALLALLGTGLDLVEPIIYRVAVNDVAGLFVDRYDPAYSTEAESPDETVEMVPATPQPSPTVQTQPTPQPSPAHQRGQRNVERTNRRQKRQQEREQKRLEKTQEAHRPDYVAPRTPRQTIKTLLWAVALLFLTGVGAYLFSLAADNRSAVLASRIEADLIQATFGHVLRLPLGFFSKQASGGLAKQIDQSDQVAPIVSAFAQELAPEAVRMVGVFAIMITQSWRMTLIALIVLPIYLLIAWRSARRLESGMSEYYEMWEKVSARIQDGLAAIKTVKLSGAEPREVARLHQASQTAYDDYLKRNRLANRYLLWQVLLSHFSKAAVFAYGGYLVLQRQLTPGDVVMFVAYLDRLYDPIDRLSSLGVNLQQHLISLKRALRLLQTRGEEAGTQELRPGPGRVEFRDVQFSYTPEREVLSGLSFALEPGQVTALVGPSGAGKTTTADLLLKLYEPSGGEILIDGQSLARLDPSSVRRALGVVAADGAVFRGTLADNIRYKRPSATAEEVRAAVRAAGLSDTLERLPDGLNTEVGERGVGLSIGERQRLQLARVLVARPRILILDEATANLDYASESEVRQALATLQPRPTMLVIAHRYSMVKDADRVIVLDAGKIIEQGTPAELSAAGGWFAQFSQGNGEAAVEVEAGEEGEND
jgi:ABC-type multidrug transport system fused ATPase/permease subunit